MLANGALITPRTLNIAIVIAVFGLMGYGLYSQYYLDLEPCPLCMTQRIFYVLCGVIALIAAIHKPSHNGYRVYGIGMGLSALCGAAAAGRQVWIQHLPPEQVPACGPSLEYMLETFPFSEALKMLVLGDGNCAEIQWSFVGLSMPEWSLIWFVGFIVAALWLVFRKA